MHIIFSLLAITFWKPFREVNERVWTFVYLLVCTAKVLSKSTEMEYRVPATCVMSPSSVASWAVPPFTWWVSYLTGGDCRSCSTLHRAERWEHNLSPLLHLQMLTLALSDTLT